MTTRFYQANGTYTTRLVCHFISSSHRSAPSSHIHINVLPAWNMGFTGKGVVIAFIDDGVEHDHPDLEHNWLSGSNNW
jgi:subtilisin family serine protease